MIRKFGIGCDRIKSKDLSFKEEGKKGKIELDETACDDLKIPLFSNLLAHLFEDAAVASSFLL